MIKNNLHGMVLASLMATGCATVSDIPSTANLASSNVKLSTETQPKRGEVLTITAVPIRRSLGVKTLYVYPEQRQPLQAQLQLLLSQHIDRSAELRLGLSSAEVRHTEQGFVLRATQGEFLFSEAQLRQLFEALN